MKMTIKNIIYIALVSTAMMFTACSEEGGFAPQSSAISVTKVTSTYIKAAGGKETITLNVVPTKAYSPSEWLTVKTMDNMVEFSAGPNCSREKRNTIVVMKYNDNDSTFVNVSQDGLILRLDENSKKRIVVHSYKESEVFTVVKCNISNKLKIISSPEWIESTFVDDTLKMKVAENKNGNTAGDIRFGYVKYAVDEVVDSIKVLQYYWTNLRGEDKWILYGYPVSFDSYGNYYPSTTNTAALKADAKFFGKEITFTFKDIKMFSDLPATDLTLKATLDYETLSFSFNNGQFMGYYLDSNGDSIHIAATTIASAYMRTFSTEPEARFELDMDDTGMLYGRITGEFPVSGGNLDIIGLWFCAFNSKNFSESTYYGQGKGDIWGLTPCWMIMPAKE